MLKHEILNLSVQLMDKTGNTSTGNIHRQLAIGFAFVVIALTLFVIFTSYQMRQQRQNSVSDLDVQDEIGKLLLEINKMAGEIMTVKQKNHDFDGDPIVVMEFLEKDAQKELQRALKNNELEIYIQFFVDTENKKVVGGEALTRWSHPEQGFLMPKSFVPYLEEEGLISAIDYNALVKSCEFLQNIYDKGKRDMFISCNFSRTTFSSPDFADQCIEIIDQHSFPKNLLILEMTETGTLPNLQNVRENAIRLKEYGVNIALDDFGENLTSFNDLNDYPVDILKLDRRLIANSHTDKGKAILKGMVRIGHDIGLKMLAEGVEKDEQADLLYEIKCDMMQGFHYHKPVSTQEALEKLEKTKA